MLTPPFFLSAVTLNKITMRPGPRGLLSWRGGTVFCGNHLKRVLHSGLTARCVSDFGFFPSLEASKFR
jgi:hypothetical protein